MKKKNECRFEGSFNAHFKKSCEYKLQSRSVSSYHDFLIKAIYALINGTAQVLNQSNLNNNRAQEISEAIRKTVFNISGKIQRIFDDDGNSLIQNYSLLRIENIDTPKFEKVTLLFIFY